MNFVFDSKTCAIFRISRKNYKAFRRISKKSERAFRKFRTTFRKFKKIWTISNPKPTIAPLPTRRK